MATFDREEIARLVDRLLDGCASQEDVRTLEERAESPAARQFLAEYLLLTGELHWLASDQNVERCREELAGKVTPAGLGDGKGRYTVGPRSWASGWFRGGPQHATLTAVAIMAVVLVAAMLIWLGTGFRPGLEPKSEVAGCASLLASCAASIEGTGDVVTPGDWVVVRHGVAEWRLSSGASLIAQAPTRFRFRENGEVELERGIIVVKTNGVAHPLCVVTPHVRCVDRGTAFGVWSQATRSEVHVLQGEVEITPIGLVSAGPRQIGAGEALGCDKSGQMAEVEYRPERFSDVVPKPLTVAAYRIVAISDPRIWLYGAFEFPRDHGKWRAVLGPGDVCPVLMRGTLTRLDVEQVAGFDSQSKAIRLSRGAYSGDTVGVALQTLESVVLPKTMTVEMIVRFDGWPQSGVNTLGCLLATRRDQRHCGVLLGIVAIDGKTAQNARLVHLFDGTAPWTETKGELVAGHWYYVAAAFAQDGDFTRVSTWLMDLSKRGPLMQVLKEGLVPGTPADGYLGVGKGFDGAMSHAYPFPGAIDELAIYNGVLEDDVIRFHVGQLVRFEKEQGVFPLPEDQ